MDLEQLTLILETIQSMGGDAKEFGIWWMVCTTIPGVIANILLFTFGVLMLRLVYRIALAVSEDNLKLGKYSVDQEINFKKLCEKIGDKDAKKEK